MKVMEPLSYEVEFTDKEEETITDCVTLLEEICTMMKDHDCINMVNTSLKLVMADIDTINETIDTLDKLISADSME